MKLDPLSCRSASTELLNTTENPRHRAILENYLLHASCEVAGYWQYIFDSSMTVQEPVYHFRGGPYASILTGREAVMGFYEQNAIAGSNVMFSEHERLSVADWGLSGDMLLHQLVPGSMLAAMGETADDHDAIYVISVQAMQLWPYNADGLLEGENVYIDWDNRTVTKLDPAEVITAAQARAALDPFIPAFAKFVPDYAK
ncbi:hypothetical protein [Rhodococcus sp. IEGM1428]|uniref:hypothetical protein n=1 Tax=Rhodococcus sp. IEGM1428 TaxID=3392191 RepID=UPI003D109EFA